ncbi:hypothetical protein FKW77_006936 [Venturia effusa]|uniref:4-hydroxy-2-oxoglutarate aldolase, mitochondrial n=1 Tax=Venturia effusa TaxID=50376 RepID=A0A517L3P4_9PEZI|nr:hypothetical protein FKW77_006936 [Venturia effusa]
MTATAKQPLVPASGIWVPAVTFIDPAIDEVALDAQTKYFRYLSSTGIAGLIVLGSNAEAFLLTPSERRALIANARAAIGPSFPLMAGVSGNSTKQVLENIKEAVEAGADYGLLLPASYFGKATTPSVIERFYTEVAEKSQLPIVIYNFPGVCNGVDLDSDMIAKLARKLPGKIVGVKLTCGSVAKVMRLAAVLPKNEFATFGGQSDFLIGGLASGSSGCICAFGNVMPKSIVKVYNLYREGKIEEAMQLHQKAALAEQSIKSGIAATKYAASLHTARAAGIAHAEELLKPRTPYEAPGEAAKKTIRDTTEEMGRIEASL